MRYFVLATDYDGTLAHHGKVDDATIDGLKRLLATGRRLVMVTGRELPELLDIFPQIDLFEWVVAENGALLYKPSTKEEKPLAEPPPEKFLQALRDADVTRVSVGRVIVATWEPHEKAVLEAIRDQGLELQVIFNKGAVMVLPAGVNKASGLTAALKEMGFSPHNTVAVGDAENDHAFFKMCELSAAVANALPSVKDTADLVLEADHGRGVLQLIDRMIEEDLAPIDKNLQRHWLKLGHIDDQEERLSPYGRTVLICGPSASGKSTVATRVIESLRDGHYQFCLLDPEGDYAEMEGVVVFGGPQKAPAAEEVLKLMEQPKASAVVCMTGMPIPDRPPFFFSLLSELLKRRGKNGRPHWIVMDEAHHLMPADWQLPEGVLPKELRNTLLITVHPELLSQAMLERVDTVLAVGPTAVQTIHDFAQRVKQPLPDFASEDIEPGQFMLWRRDQNEAPRKVAAHPSTIQRRRHTRKYAEGQLPPDRSFYFQGPEGKLNLRAQNLMLFLQLADGVDDDTWEHHLRNGDYAKWFLDSIKDEGLAKAAQGVAEMRNLSPEESRKLIRQAVEKDYTLPASGPLPVPGAS